MVNLLPTHASQADVLFNGFVVSQYFNDMNLAMARDKAEVSAFRSTWKSYVAGLNDAVATFSGLFDASVASAIDPLMFAAMASGDNSWLMAPQGAQTAASFGNEATNITGINTKYEVKSALTAANTITAEVQMDNTGGGVDHGYIYAPWVTQVGSGNTSSLDNGAQTTAGGVLIVYTFTDTASLVVSLFDSADNSTFAAVSGYTISPANGVQAAYRFPAAGVAPSGTIRRYTRINWTGTGTFLAMFSRK